MFSYSKFQTNKKSTPKGADSLSGSLKAFGRLSFPAGG
jgi:hypothetical protein